MKAVEVPDPGEPFEVVERDVPDPGPDEVRVAVEACGICHSDAFVKEGQWPGVDYPRVPGHEVAGRVDAVGDDVTEWADGDRVGVGWHGGHCFTCDACRRGDFITCENGAVTGISYDGGYAEYMTAPHEALARIPEELDAVDAAPLLCAGITTFNSLRNTDARPGDLVAVQGVGGLGHLGIQYARAAGFETVAVSTSPDKEDLAYELGADHFVDASANDAAEELQSMGGATVILGTAPSTDAMESIAGGLGVDGTLLTIAVPGDELSVNVQPLVQARQSVAGWPSGTPRESQDTLEFSALRDVTPRVETFSLEEAEAAYDAMMNNDVRFRSVLVP
jgi:D-arabinose 1-dehydrogenase-like Zn-dependent alcohol dehydrogenase